MKLIKVPLNCGALAKKKGIQKAPDAIIKKVKDYFMKESAVLPFIEEESVKLDNSNIEESNNAIIRKVSNLDAPAILIGGDHSLTYAGFKAYAKMHKNPGLVIFDAHLDCENNFSPPTHEDFLKVLIEEDHVQKTNVIHVGLRNFHSKEIEYAKAKKLKIFDMREIIREGVVETADAFTAAARQFDSLYISVDIDVLDPAFAPGTGYIEPGGLTARQLIYFIQRLKNLRNIGLWDLVEVNPDKDLNEMTVCAAAKLVVEMS